MLQVQVLFLFPPPIIEVSMIRVSIILFRLVHANNNSNKKCACLIACFLPNYTCNFSAVLLPKCVHTIIIGILQNENVIPPKVTLSHLPSGKEDRASSSDALGSRFEPHSVCIYIWLLHPDAYRCLGSLRFSP